MASEPILTAPVLTAEGVGKSFDKFVALDGVDLELRAGERRALIGPNGAGKTTFINVIGGQLSGGTGRIRFEGRDLIALRPDRIARLGVARTFQISRTYRTMSVYENMCASFVSAAGKSFSLFPSRFDDLHDQIWHMLETVDLQDLAGARVDDISAGDRKRLEFGMALAAKPRLLLLDEPTAGMGLKERHALMDLVVGQLASAGLTLLFVEHDIDVVFKYAEFVTVMVRGKVFVEGAPDDIAKNEDVQDVYLGRGH